MPIINPQVFLYHVKTKPGAGDAAFDGRLCAIEWFKKVIDSFRWNANTIIDDFDDDHIIFMTGINDDAAGWGVFDGIVQQYGNDFPVDLKVAEYQRQVGFDSMPVQ